MDIRKILAQRTVPYETLERMMDFDAGEVFETDGPTSEQAISETESLSGKLPNDYRRWIARFGAACTHDETVIVYGVSISEYKLLREPREVGLEIACLDEGDDLRILDKHGCVFSTGYDESYPCFSSFLASLLCGRSLRVEQEFKEELGRLPTTGR